MLDPWLTLAELMSARGQDRGIYFTHAECSYLFNQIKMLSLEIEEQKTRANRAEGGIEILKLELRNRDKQIRNQEEQLESYRGRGEVVNEGDIVVVWSELKKGKASGYNITLFETEEEANEFVGNIKALKQHYDAAVCRIINWNGKGKLGNLLEAHGKN